MTPLQTTPQVLLTHTGNAFANFRLIDLLYKGGWVMVPILLLSLWALYIIIERILVLHKASYLPAALVEHLKSLMKAGNLAECLQYCHQNNTLLAKILTKAIQETGTHHPHRIREAVELIGKNETHKLEKNLPMLGTIAGTTPMLGFLGTVTGMIQAFIVIAEEAAHISPKLLASGIYEAMVTTAAGLAVGIPAYLGYNYLITKLQGIVYRLEDTLEMLVQALPN